MKYLSLLILILSTSFHIKAQVVPDFIISDPGSLGDIAIDNKNNIHIVWSSLHQDSAGNEDVYINYSVYDSLGNVKLRPKIITSASNSSPSIAIRKNYATIAYRKLSITFNSYIYGKIIDLTLGDVGNEFLINDIFFDAERANPDVSYLNDTTFLVVWNGGGPQPPGGIYGEGIYAQVFDMTLGKIGNNILVSDHGGSGVKYSSARILGFPLENKFVAVWRDDYSGENRIYGRLYKFDSNPIDSSFLITEDANSNNIFYFSVAMDSMGNLAVVWGSEGKISWRWFDKNRMPFGPSETITNKSIGEYNDVDISIDKDGKGLVAWETGINDYDKIFAWRFGSDRKFIGTVFRLSNNDGIISQLDPHIVLKDNRIYSAWDEQVGTNTSIVGSIIDFFNPPSDIKETYQAENVNSFNLFQNYPNPFNPLTNIKFEIHNFAFVWLKIFDIVGMEVKMLINQELAPGIYNVMWKGDNNKGEQVSSGLYLYKLVVNDNYLMKKMLLIR